ncbi:MAG: hypothetical protein JWN64_225 [Parcubacteria group bacterium]|nr:hypothetical protein [Parcubacteria group bacterium]
MESLFKKFLETIRLTDVQEEDARRKYNGVSKALHDAYYPNTTYDGSTKLLVGSYGKATYIRPPRDIDILFQMPATEFKRFDSLAGNKQSQLLQEIRSALKSTYTTTEVIKAFGKVVVIEFADNTHNVELLPAWKLVDGTFRIPDTENGGSWQIYDPVREMQYIRDSSKKTGKTLDLVRFCKKWADHCGVPIKSFVIEVLVVQYLDSLGDAISGKGYAILVNGFFEYLLTRVNGTVITASGEAISLGNAWQSRVETAGARAAKALDFDNNGDLPEASMEWRKVFGDNFPSAEVTKSLTVSFHQIVAKLQTLFPSFGEEFLDRTYGIPTVINPTYSVTVDVNVNQKGWRKNHWLLSEFQIRGFRIQKSASLVFQITSHNVPPPYSVKWKVRNFGNEANNLGALRGEITDDNGTETKKESTLYHGEHYVECYMIKNGQCVATGHVFVPIG